MALGKLKSFLCDMAKNVSFQNSLKGTG
jgi:hypothetical protein